MGPSLPKPLSPQKVAKGSAGYGFRCPRSPPFVAAVTIAIPDFPHQMRQAVSEWTKSTLGIPLASREIREAIEQHRFARPAQHAAKIEVLQLHGKTQKAPDERVPALMGHIEGQALTVTAVLERNVGCTSIDPVEVLFYCAATFFYAYERYGRGEPDQRFLEEFKSVLAASCAKRSVSHGDAVQAVRSRHKEYAGLYDALFERERDEAYQRHWLVTIMMHLVERASGHTAEGKMIQTVANAASIAAVFDESYRFARGELEEARE